jgi:ABC-2 type transport system permease protein
MTRDIGDLIVPLFFPFLFTVLFAFAFSGIQGPDGGPFFNTLAPGMVVFALLLLTVGVSGSLSREIEKGTLSRLKLSLMSSFDLLFGILLPWSVIAAIQVVSLFGMSILLGFEWSGGIPNLAAALLIGEISGIASVALGLIIATFSKSEGLSGQLSTVVVVPMAMLVSGFIPLQIGIISEILPWGQAATSLKTLLTHGGQISAVLPRIGTMAVETIIVFIIGVMLFSRRRLGPD